LHADKRFLKKRSGPLSGALGLLIDDSNQGGPSPMKPRVLIIDDDEAITQQLFWTLCVDYDVMTANDFQTAVRRATIYAPDVSILDLRLPPTDSSTNVGLRILEYIKAHVPQSKVVVMTGAGGTETQKACQAGGADEFLSKPFDISELLSTVRRLTGLRQLDVA
jgi:DNA-binding NtrC family response regulator